MIRVGIFVGILSLVSACGGNGESGPAGTELPIPTANFAISTSSVSEGSSTEVQVILSSAAPGNVIIPFTLTGTAGSADYTSSVTPLTIPAGSSSGSIYIAPTDDIFDESDETLVIAMGTPTHATLGTTTSATITIVDTDVPSVHGRVTDSVAGSGIPGVTVRVGSSTAITDSDGQYTVTGFPSAPVVVVNFEHGSYALQGRRTDSISMASAPVSVPMVSVPAAPTFDPTQSITVTVPNSPAQVQLAANTLRTANGAMPSGNVTAEVTPILPASNLAVMPGNYIGVNGSGPEEPMESYGALDVRFTDANGERLTLAAGQTATLRIPVSSRAAAPPDPVPLFYYDTVFGIWRQEGSAIRQGTAPNLYYEGVVSHFTTWNADELHAFVNVTGCVQDALGIRIPDAVVTAEGIDYAGRASAVTNSEGNFTLRVKPNSDAFLQATKEGAVSNSPPIATSGTDLSVTPCLVLSGNNLSIKLTWGSAPSDLDSHTLGANSDEHVYFSSKGSLTAAPYIALDVDDVTGFGPEVTTFTRLARNRRYSFYVHNYSETFSPGQTGSPARVELTAGGTQTIFTPPAGETNQTEYWHVFDVTTNNNCAITVVPVQQFSIAEPTNQNVGNAATYCQ